MCVWSGTTSKQHRFRIDLRAGSQVKQQTALDCEQCATGERRPVILTFNKFYLPGYRAGGPIRTLANMVDRLGDLFDFRIVTLDRDSGDAGPYPAIEPGRWMQVGKAQVMYLPANRVSLSMLVGIGRDVTPDVIYLNSFFDPTFTQRVLWARRLGLLHRAPIVLAPRGEFSLGALKLKRAKKLLYLRGSSLVGLYRHLTWQASSERERADILRDLPFVQSGDIIEAMDLAPGDDQAHVIPSVRKGGAPLQVCFLSRISPMKNLDFALRALARVKADVVFNIYGPKEVPGYWAECEALICAMPANVRVKYERELIPTEVRATLSRHDLFLFPTRGENYGHVIHEALGAGLPVLISDQTPWGEVAERGVGWVHPLSDTDAFAVTIDDYASWGSERVAEHKARAVAYAHERALKVDVLHANIKMLSEVAASDFCGAKTEDPKKIDMLSI